MLNHQDKSADIANEILEVEKQQAVLIGTFSTPHDRIPIILITSCPTITETGQLSSAELDNRLEALYRENVKNSEAVQHIIENEQSSDMSLLPSISLLKALREASEDAQRIAISNSSQRNAKLKRKAGAMDDSEDVSAAPSPRANGSVSRDRLGVDNKPKRGGSVPSTREVSVKVEDGAESVTSSVEGSKREFSFPPCFHHSFARTRPFVSVLLIPTCSFSIQSNPIHPNRPTLETQALQAEQPD